MSKFHLAGIVPVANLKSDFDLITPEIMLPVNKGFTAIQKSVFECAMAGCSTIWIVANDDLAPIVRKNVGEWVYDPVYYSKLSRFSSESRREIPIYYVPIHPKDRDRRDSYGWGALYGMHSAWRAAYDISKWVVPQKYFVSFPMSVYNIHSIRPMRRAISDKESNFFLMYNGKTVKDGIPISFTMFGEDFKRCRKSINQKTTREYLPPSPGQQYPSEKLPLRERWSARDFNLGEVFGEISEQGSKKISIPWYYDISNWSGYRNYLGSDNCIEVPEKALTKQHRHVKLPYTKEE